jgi:hypothetical protein
VDVLNNYLEQTLDGYKDLVQNTDVQDALRIAEEWGMNRPNHAGEGNNSPELTIVE